MHGFGKFYLMHFPHKSKGYSIKLFFFRCCWSICFRMPFLHPYKQQSFMDRFDRSIRISMWVSPSEITSSEETNSRNKISSIEYLTTRAVIHWRWPFRTLSTFKNPGMVSVIENGCQEKNKWNRMIWASSTIPPLWAVWKRWSETEFAKPPILEVKWTD